MKLETLLSTPVSGGSLALLRIAVGLVMALEAFALLVPHDAAITSGTPLERYYTGADNTFHWPYEGFEWLPMLPSSMMYGLVVLLCIAGVTMAIGFSYRVSAIAVFGIWAYLFAVESTRTYWQSHYYLELLVCFLLVWMPAANRYSVDAWRRANASSTQTVPFWTIFLLRSQLVIAYFYAGVAKFSLDWFFDAIPVRWFLSDPNVTTPYESYLSGSRLAAVQGLLHSSQLAYFLSWTGAVFDVSIGFLLLFRRTRIFGLVLMLSFHAFNHLIMFDDIGWFPFVGVATALIFLEPDWPDRTWRWLRRPHLSAPDKWWALIGFAVFPVIGISLGWRLQPTKNDENQKPVLLSKYVVPCVVAWLVWQSLLPIRQHFINSDARFTYEGFSFSWRLKADTRHAIGHKLRIVDSKVIYNSSAARSVVDWEAWPFESVAYRRVRAGQVVWPAMPEFSVVLEPLLGERIIYNPYSGRTVSHSDAGAARRVTSLWMQLYGREPRVIVPLSISQTIDAIIKECDASTVASAYVDELKSLLTDVVAFEQLLASPAEAGATLRRVQIVLREMLEDERVSHSVRPNIRKMYPLSLHGEMPRPAAFFIVEDSEVIKQQADRTTRVDRANWKHNSSTKQPGSPLHEYRGDEPLVVYMGPLGVDIKHLLPAAYISESHTNKRFSPRMHWNSLRDMSASKFVHASGQAFYLRRYADRVASIWEEKCGRRPAIYATTAVSYNGRPHQKLVDPSVDLARASVSWFAHNAWIRDLEMSRIPRDVIAGKKRTSYSREKR